ncbi:MAG: hypothetical protein AB7S93_19730 [Xanthobacteraceae bacterium]
MKLLVLCGAALVALAFGPASAADLVLRPIVRAPSAVYAHPPVQRAPVATVRARRGNLCWVETGTLWRFGSWQPCPRNFAARTVRAGSAAAARGSRRGAGTVRHVGAPDAPSCIVSEARKQYWATSLSGDVDRTLLQALQDAVARGETGWLDVNPDSAAPIVTEGVNLILYDVGGNCYIGSDCARFPASKALEGRWSEEEREIDLNDPDVRKIVVDDMIGLVKQADQWAPSGAIVGVHLDNVHRLDADALALLFNEYLQAVDTARQDLLISNGRAVGYVAKNNPEGFKEALDKRLLKTPPLYLINENALLGEKGEFDESTGIAQALGRSHNIPVFLMTFGSDIAYVIERGGKSEDVHVSEDMARQMARRRNITGVAWSPDEQRYHPTLFVQGAPIGSKTCEKVAAAGRPPAPAAKPKIAGRTPRRNAPLWSYFR